MGKLARIYDEILESTPVVAVIYDAHLDAPEVVNAREVFFDTVKKRLEQRLSALAIYECVRLERIAPEEGEWGKGDATDFLVVDGVSPLAYVHQTIEDEKKVIRFGVMPVDRAGEQLLAAIEEADEALSRAFFGG